MNSKSIVEGYLKKNDWRVSESSNSIYSYGGLSRYTKGEVFKDYWLRYVYPEHISKAYVSGDIHIHDLGDLTLYCCGYSLKDIILKGVGGVENIPRSIPAKHFDSILSQVANLTTVYQNEIAGAVAFNGVDTLLAPFIKYDKLTYQQVKQSLQNFIFGINSNSRSGAEPAFSNATFDLTPPEDLIDEYAIVGGELMSFTYGSCQQEMDMFNRAFFEIMLGGDGEDKLFAYPIPTYNIHKRFDWNNPNNKLLWEMAGKYGTPYFANFINSELDISDVRSMCPLSHDTEIFTFNSNKITKSEIGDLYTRSTHGTKYKVWTNNGWLDAKINQFDATKVLKIKFSNGSEVKMGINHLQPTKDYKTIKASELKEGMWIPFNKMPFGTDLGTYELGYIVGAFIGDGSYGSNDRITYSLCAFEKDDETEKILTKTWKDLGFNVHVVFNDKNVRSLQVSSGAKKIIEKYVSGDSALTKGLTQNVYSSSLVFKNGLIDGLRATDGSREKNRIYTSSLQLKNDLCCLFSTLGEKYMANYEDNRESRLGTNTNYRVDYPKRNTYGNYFTEDENYNYFKIVEISEYDYKSPYLYCVELDNEDKLFSLSNGLITHNCRLSLNLNELRKKNGGLFGAGDSTGSIGVVTINAPRLGYISKTKEELFSNLDNILEICKESLEIKRKWLEENVVGTGLISAFDYYVGTINNHFSTIGILGENEMCINFLGEDITSEKGKNLCLEVGNYINGKLIKFQEETGHLYNYEATPAESTCYRLAKADKKIYPDIFTQGSNKDIYYTNSCHIPVQNIENIAKTFEHQNDLQVQFSGGTVIHIYLDGAISGEQAKSIVNTVCNNYNVPYISLSPISRYCEEHGYIKEKVDKCPYCKSKLKLYQRITGYLRCIDNFNVGKKAEFKNRKQLNENS